MDRFLTHAAGPRRVAPISKLRHRLGVVANMLRLILHYPDLLSDGLFWKWQFDTAFSPLRRALDGQVHPTPKETRQEHGS